MTNAGTCRWGILGAATIARKNWQAIRDSGNGTLVAVASRDPLRAEQFIRECQSSAPHPVAPRASGYEELLASPDIDAVYVPLPTGLRTEWVVRAARSGKHVLCEKPCAPTSAQLDEMLAACREHRVQFMDGVMFMHSGRLPSLRETLDDGQSVGPLRRIATQFSFRGDDAFHQGNIRVQESLEPLGCLGDLGWYNIRLTLWVMRYTMPQRVTGRILAATPGGVPLEFSGELLFPGDVSASFYCSFLAENQQWGVISGTKGRVELPDFVLPFFGGEVSYRVCRADFDVQGCVFNMVPRVREVALPEYTNNHPTSQECQLFRTFNRQVLSGELDPHWPQIAEQTQRVLDACLASAREDGRAVAL